MEDQTKDTLGTAAAVVVGVPVAAIGCLVQLGAVVFFGWIGLMFLRAVFS